VDALRRVASYIIQMATKIVAAIASQVQSSVRAAFGELVSVALLTIEFLLREPRPPPEEERGPRDRHSATVRKVAAPAGRITASCPGG